MRVSKSTILLAATLFAINFYIAHELFSIEYLRFMGSIEAAYIGIARYALHHWRDLAWFPLWYGGIPYQNTYPPLLHLSVAAFAAITRWSPAHAYHFAVALAYCLGPVALFALALRISGSRAAAFAAGLIYSTISFSAWIMPVVRHDLGSVFYPRRFQALVLYGEGPHVLAMTLLPLAILAIDRAIEKRSAPRFFVAAIALAAVALTNWLGAFSLAIAMSAYLVAKIGKKDAFWSILAYLSCIAICAYFLAMPMIPPSTIAVTQANAKLVGGDFRNVYSALPLRGGIIVAAAALLKWLTRRLSWHVQFAILFAFVLGSISVPAVNADWNVVPQAARYQLEFEMAMALLLGFVLQKKRAAAIVILAIALIYPLRRERNYSRNFLLRDLDITKTIEFREAQWLNRNWNGERVMMPGSVAFWLTAFSDTPELAGGFDQGRIGDTGAVALYEIGVVDRAEESILWLKALGVHAAGVSGPGSTEVYHSLHNPAKFEGLEVLWRDGGDTIYRVGADASLARVVPREAIVSRKPIHGLDVDPLRAYVAAIEDPRMPRAEFQWTSAHSARIRGTLAQGEVISVQETWHAGWRANAAITRDALGQMVMDPGRAGAFDINLIYDGGMEMKIAKILRASTAILLALLSLRAILKKAW